jgi:cellulose synthase/poly-beta-1,6-N-acetylglucosamine synthase-like glycosyltransferase
MMYHSIMMPINNRINCVFFCGTAGALRKSALEDVGGWTPGSVTEDSDLSVRLLMKGYRTVYLESETPSEVPDTFDSFIRQQMRWCYGNARVFFDNFWKILTNRTLKVRQKVMIAFITLANASAPFVVIMTFFGLSGWFIGEPNLFNWHDIIVLVSRFFFTAGFLLMGLLTLYRYKAVKEFGYFVLSSFTVGIVLAVANSFAFVKAMFNSKLHWFCTPKTANEIVEGVS